MNHKQIVKLKALFNERTVDDNDEIPVGERQMFMDAANVFGIVPKTRNFLRVFTELFECSAEGKRVPEIVWKNDKGLEPTSSFSVEYLKRVLAFITVGDSEKAIITVGYDYPLRIETDDCIVFLAPMMRDDA